MFEIIELVSIVLVSGSLLSLIFGGWAALVLIRKDKKDAANQEENK